MPTKHRIIVEELEIPEEATSADDYGFYVDEDGFVHLVPPQTPERLPN